VWGKPGIVEGGINSGTLLRGGLTQVEVGGTQWNSTDASGSGTRFPSSTSTILVTTREPECHGSVYTVTMTKFDH
jgi:hypothetical protein